MFVTSKPYPHAETQRRRESITLSGFAGKPQADKTQLTSSSFARWCLEPLVYGVLYGLAPWREARSFGVASILT
jgi:hypothetical protein